MKYLIKHKKEFVITLTALIVAIFDFLKVFGTDIQIDQTSIYAIVSAIMGVLVWFYNMPTSNEGDTAKTFLKELKEGVGKVMDFVEEPEDSEVK